jgi:hypothetical protein
MTTTTTTAAAAAAALPFAGHSEPVTEPTLTTSVINIDSQVRSPFNPHSYTAIATLLLHGLDNC